MKRRGYPAGTKSVNELAAPIGGAVPGELMESQPQLTEDDVCRIVREEYAKIQEEERDATQKGLRAHAQQLWDERGTALSGTLYDGIYDKPPATKEGRKSLKEQQQAAQDRREKLDDLKRMTEQFGTGGREA